MAMDLKRERDVMADINITPLTDVLLVLLVIFMVTASAITQAGFNIKLPKSVSQDNTQTSEVTISITRDQQIFVGRDKVDAAHLFDHLKSVASRSRTNRVVINADTMVPYGVVVSAMDASRRAGLFSIGLSTQKEGGP
jgi:biopolymer transport protein TolR